MEVTRTRRIAVSLGGATAAAALALVVASVVGPAGASSSDSGDATSTTSAGRSSPMAELRACMKDSGVSLHDFGMHRGRGGAGAAADAQSQADRDAMRACIEKVWTAHHDELAACMKDQGAEMPAMPKPGEGWRSLNDAQRAALRACAEKLGGGLPGGGMHGFMGRGGARWSRDGASPCDHDRDARSGSDPESGTDMRHGTHSESGTDMRHGTHSKWGSDSGQDDSNDANDALWSA